MEYHDVDAFTFGPPALQASIKGRRLTVKNGFWPDVGGSFVHVADTTLRLKAADCAVLIRRTGEPDCEIVTASQLPLYGMQPIGDGKFCILEHVDLLAWRVGTDWHIKRLVQGE